LSGPVPEAIRHYSELHDLELHRFASLEAQCAAIADDIAYNAHDIDDGLRSGLLTLEMLQEPLLPGRIVATVREKYPHLDPVRTGHELVRRQITIMVEDVIAAARENLAVLKPGSVEDVRDAGRAIVAFSPAMAEEERDLKAFLYRNLYRHPSVLSVRKVADRIVRELFEAYFAEPREMPEGWREGLDRAEEHIKARDVADFLAGMTDTYALKEHARLFDRIPELR